MRIASIVLIVFCACGCVPRVQPVVRVPSASLPPPCPVAATARCDVWTVGACLPPDLDPGRVSFVCGADCYDGGDDCHFGVTVGCRVIFADGFESGNMSAWSKAGARP